jgi:putative membrane protein
MTGPPEDPRVRFAAERTLLAWVRTGLALMGFGFVVARFGLFLRELPAVAPGAAPPHAGWSSGFGVALVLLGVAVCLLAGLEYRTVLGRIDRGEPYRPPVWSLGLVVAAALAAVGLSMAGYLLAS